jgi:hypothetical protein
LVKLDDVWIIELEQRGVTATETAEKLKTEKKVVDSTVQGDLL